MSGGPKTRGVPPHCPPAPSSGNTSAPSGGVMAQKRSELVLVMPPPLPSTCISAAPPQQPRSSPQSRSLLEHTCQRVVAAGRVRTRVHPGLRRRAGWRRRARGHRCSHVIMARELTPSPALPVLVSRMYLDSPLAPRSCPFSHLARPVAPLAPAALRPCGPAAQRPRGPAALRPCGASQMQMRCASAARESFAAIRAAAVGRRALPAAAALLSIPPLLG